MVRLLLLLGLAAPGTKPETTQASTGKVKRTLPAPPPARKRRLPGKENKALPSPTGEPS